MGRSRLFMISLWLIPTSLMLAVAALLAIATHHPVVALWFAAVAAASAAPALIMIALVSVLRIHDTLGTWWIAGMAAAFVAGTLAFGPRFLDLFGFLPVYMVFDALRQSEAQDPIL